MDIASLIGKVKETGKDQSKAKEGGGYQLPKEGLAMARLVGYFELGKHEEKFKQEVKIVNKVDLVFELVGEDYPARDTDEGPVPQRMTLSMVLSDSPKSHYFKLFSKLRIDETHMTQMLGKPFLIDIVHRKVGDGENAKTYANINRDTIRHAVQEMLVDGKMQRVPIPVPPAKTELKMFVFGLDAGPSKIMWDGIYIPGEYPARKDEKTGEVIMAAKSKNVIQEKIKSALNVKDLSIYDLIVGNIKAAGADALAAVVGDVASPSETKAALADPAPTVVEDKPPFPLGDDPMAGIS